MSLLSAIAFLTIATFSAIITPQTGTDDLFWPLVWQGATTVLMFLPLSLATLGAIPKEDIAIARKVRTDGSSPDGALESSKRPN